MRTTTSNHQSPTSSYLSPVQGLKDVVEDAKSTLMVLDEEGAILTRIWCLYEAWQTSIKSKEALVLMTYGIKIEPLEKV